MAKHNLQLTFFAALILTAGVAGPALAQFPQLPIKLPGGASPQDTRKMQSLDRNIEETPCQNPGLGKPIWRLWPLRPARSWSGWGLPPVTTICAAGPLPRLGPK
jgi:hypothetical protein